MGLFLKKRVEMPDKIILGNTEFVFDRKLGFHVGEWTVWDRKTKILLEFQSTEGNIGDIVLEKVNWVNDHKDTIIRVPFPVSWTVKMKKKQKETQDILSYHSQAAGCSDKARAKASGGRQPIEECGRTGL